MLSFIGRSIIQKIFTLFFVSIVSFLIVYPAPGKVIGLVDTARLRVLDGDDAGVGMVPVHSFEDLLKRAARQELNIAKEPYYCFFLKAPRSP